MRARLNDLGDGASLVALARYPLNEPTASPYRDLVAHCRNELASNGGASLPGFVTAPALAAITGEALPLATQAHYSNGRSNVFFGSGDERFPPGDPRREEFDHTNAFVPADVFPKPSLIRQLYDWPNFAAFIADCLARPIHKYADPLADVILNVVDPGQEFHWHFDSNELSITIMLQAADSGGHFEYVPDLRHAGDEAFADVAAVLAGDERRVVRLSPAPGALQIFRGRHSLHRVTRVQGTRARIVAIYSFADEPGMVGRLGHSRHLYGKALALHHEAEKRARRDGLIN